MLLNERLTPHIQQMRQRVQTLYQEGNGTAPKTDLLAAAFEELELAIEQLQLAEIRQGQEYEAWLNERAALEIEMQSFRHLFDNAPAGYLVTSLDGTIRKANPLAAKMLECSERNLIGRSIALFVPEGQRREFRAQIAQFAENDGTHEKTIVMQSWEHNSLEAGLTVAAVQGKTNGRPIALHWLIRDIGELQEAVPALTERVVGGPINGGAPGSGADGTDLDNQNDMVDATRQRFTFLARAVAELSSLDELDAVIAQVAHLAVPEQADACIIDLAASQTDTMQRLVVMRDTTAKGGVRTWRGTLLRTSRTNGQARATSHKLPSTATGLSHIDILKHDDLRAVLGTLQSGSAIVAPLQSGERQLGSITFMRSKAKDRQYGAADVTLIEVLAGAISDAVIRLQEV